MAAVMADMSTDAMNRLAGEGAQPLSILFAIPALDRGGPDRVFFELLRCVDRNHFSPSLVVSNAVGYYLDRLPRDVAVHVLPVERSVYLRYPVWQLARLVRQLRPDVVFATLRMTMTAGLARAVFPRRTTLVLRIANQISANYSELQRRAPIKHRLSHRLQMLALSRADRIICQSIDMAEDLRAVGLRVPTTVIGNPIDVEEVLRLALPPVRLAGEPALLSVGRLVPQKGFDILLSAFAALRSRHLGAVLSIAGEGPERQELEEQCRRLQLSEAVRFLGFVQNPYPLMAGADLFLLASRYEGFPNVVLEALACGTPVVATDCPGGTRDLVVPGMSGWLARPADPQHLTQVLDAAISQHHALKAESIRNFVSGRFGSKLIASTYEEALVRGTFIESDATTRTVQ